MDRPRLIRGLRIAWSVAFGILCVVLIVLWVRSYWWVDLLLVKEAGSKYIGIKSVQGRFIALNQMVVSSATGTAPLIVLGHIENEESALKYQDDNGKSPYGLWFHYLRFSRGQRSEIHVPQWFFVLVLGAVAAAPWIHWSKRFSLRTLLIATTLIAVVLGLAVWSIAQ